MRTYLIAHDISFVPCFLAGQVWLPQKHLVMHTLGQHNVSQPAHTVYIGPMHLCIVDRRICAASSLDNSQTSSSAGLTVNAEHALAGTSYVLWHQHLGRLVILKVWVFYHEVLLIRLAAQHEALLECSCLQQVRKYQSQTVTTVLSLFQTQNTGS